MIVDQSISSLLHKSALSGRWHKGGDFGKGNQLLSCTGQRSVLKVYKDFILLKAIFVKGKNFASCKL